MKQKSLLITLFCLVLQVVHAQKALILKKYKVEYAVKNAGFKSALDSN